MWHTSASLSGRRSHSRRRRHNFPTLRIGAASIACIIPFALSAQTMKDEADSFLAGMPEGLQLRQEHAVREAIDGNTSPLGSVRASRNIASLLPEGVQSIDIGMEYRLYRPETAGDTPLPALVYLHGGGWCFGSINSCAAFCGALACEGRIAVLAVDYPLAPEHPYPAAIERCLEALKFISENASDYNIDSSAISIGGDSAGGNLALATAIKLAETQSEGTRHTATSPIEIKSLILFYPVTRACVDNTSSWHDYATGFGLDGTIMDAFNQAYAGTNNPATPLISPVYASATLLAQMPPTLIINAERDILCDQGEEMYTRLREAGADTHREVFEGAVHLFITVPGQPTAFKKAVRLTADFLAR